MNIRFHVKSFAILLLIFTSFFSSACFNSFATPVSEPPQVVGVDVAEGTVKEIEAIDCRYFITIHDGANDSVYYLDLDFKASELDIKAGDVVRIHYALGTPEKYHETTAMPASKITIVSSKEMPVGVSSTEGTVTSVEIIGNMVFVTIVSGKFDSSYYISLNQNMATAVQKLQVGDTIKINYALGTPEKYKNSTAMPLSSVEVLKPFEATNFTKKSVIGTVKSIKHYRRYVILTINTNRGFQDFYTRINTPLASELLELKKGLAVEVQYTLGASIGYQMRTARPLDSYKMN